MAVLPSPGFATCACCGSACAAPLSHVADVLLLVEALHAIDCQQVVSRNAAGVD